MEAHAHAHPADDEEFLARCRHAQLLAQFDEFEQRIRAVEHPDLRACDSFKNLASPLVDQVWRTEDEGAAIAFGVENGRQRDADGGFARAHFAIDDRGPLAMVGEQLGGGMDDFCLGREQLALETGQHELTVGVRRTAVDGWIGPVERVQQFVAELGDEVLQAQGELAGCGIEKVAGRGRGVCGGRRFELHGHGDAPKKRGAHRP